MTETVLIDDLQFEIRRSPRRRTLGLTVDRAGDLVVHAPTDSSVEELERWARTRLLWVYQKLARKEVLTIVVTPIEYVTGESFSYLGRNYRLKLIKGQREALYLDGETFLLRRDIQKNAAKHFRAWYRRNGLQWLELRVAQLMPRIGAVPTNIVVRDLGNRWGSCSCRGAIAFHWRLLQLPIGLIDYVIIHELAHLKEGNHGPAFWTCVERALPDWRERQELLAKLGLRYLRLTG